MIQRMLIEKSQRRRKEDECENMYVKETGGGSKDEDETMKRAPMGMGMGMRMRMRNSVHRTMREGMGKAVGVLSRPEREGQPRTINQ